ncbi:unnamed protein product, partial [Effrenium voratum]
WALWEYEFKHWKYHKRRAGGDEYSQLYNTHRLPEYQHLMCPAIPLVFRLWSNFPTCPPTRLRDLARFTDAQVSAMTVDNWRASYRDFLSEDYNYNVSHFSGGDPTWVTVFLHASWRVSNAMGCCLERLRAVDESPGLRHVATRRSNVMFTFSEDAKAEQEIALLKALASLPEKIPSILRWYVQSDLRLPGGQQHPAGKNRSLVWLADFKTAADYEAFAQHAEHQALLANFSQLIDPKSRAALQYSDPRPLMEGVHHIVMFSIKDDASSAQMRALETSLYGLKQSIKEVASLRMVADLALPSGQKSPEGKNRSVAVLVDFTSIEKYQVYETHPDHLSVIEKFIKPISGAHSIFAGVFIQKMPTDLWCYQQVIHDLRPGYIVDLGSSQGGSAVWFASMLKLFEIPGQVISVDLSLEQAYWLSKKRAEDAAKRLKLEQFIDWNYVLGGSKSKEVRQK